MASQQWVCAGKFGDLEEDVGVRVQLPAGRKKDAVALFKHGGQLYALEDSCCHAGKSIHGGDIEDLGTVVVSKRGELGTGGLCVQCPRHQRKFAGGLYFSLETGKARTPEHTSKFKKMDKHRVKVHDVRVDRAGFVYVSAQPRSKHRQKAALAEIVVEDSDEDQHQRRRRDSASAAADVAPLAQEKRLRGREAAAEQMWACSLDQLQQVSHNTFVFHLRHPADAELPRAPSSPIWHVTLRASISGQNVEREYTPVSTWSEWQSAGCVRLLIKIYPDGVMTQHLAALGLGTTIWVSAPQTTLSVPAFLPLGRRSSAAAGSGDAPRHVVMFAAGTGVVPMVQALSVALQSDVGLRTVTLLYSSRAPADLLCWEEIRALASRREAARETPPGFRLRLAFSAEGGPVPEASQPWVEVIHRRLDAEAVAQALPDLTPAEPIRVLVSGPEGFFGSMREAFPAHLQEAAVFVDLDDD